MVWTVGCECTSDACIGVIRNFFFQAEDGIRDGHVTGVQTCALPIFLVVVACLAAAVWLVVTATRTSGFASTSFFAWLSKSETPAFASSTIKLKIGRASCRERV